MPIVVLLSGASGAGKTSLSYRLAARLGAALVEADDLVVGVQALTTAQQQPDLFVWHTHDAAAMPVDEVVAAQARFARALQPAVDAVVANHIETRTPVVIEGDYVLPRPRSSDVWSAVVHEDDERQLAANFAAREPDVGAQLERAAASGAYGRWLVDRARAAGAAVVAARPWDTAFDRLLTELGVVGVARYDEQRRGQTSEGSTHATRTPL